jgi:hypothetical protein
MAPFIINYITMVPLGIAVGVPCGGPAPVKILCLDLKDLWGIL